MFTSPSIHAVTDDGSQINVATPAHSDEQGSQRPGNPLLIIEATPPTHR